MTGSVAGAPPSAAVMTTLAAAGSQRYAWLLLAFPLAGAVILLLGGKRTNSWGHLVGATMPVAAFAYGVVAFVTMLSYPAAQRSRLMAYGGDEPIAVLHAGLPDLRKLSRASWLPGMT